MTIRWHEVTKLTMQRSSTQHQTNRLACQKLVRRRGYDVGLRSVSFDGVST
ncbi:hypothetical protein RB943 [Rhodopirellula baltica SH 1]|uniref:Uncharacterized protein n=1 Tax=Rhodopirellula baltica (strain DSM 10527 / NCIMB 13988 / SH1) TaxID=243090 RepID=Q7UY16_RHOBA|nr:hypothetical protein RB943 [Rhodopirellula baltica SH 1]